MITIEKRQEITQKIIVTSVPKPKDDFHLIYMWNLEIAA